MANTAYICRTRTDIPAGTLQITDLHPNTSQRSLIYQPNPQSGYAPTALQASSTIAGNTAANLTTANLSGLSAYIADVTNDEVSGFQLSEANVDTITTAILAKVSAGEDLTDAALITLFDVTVGLNTLPFESADGTAGTASLGSREDFMKILSGGKYLLPTGSIYNAGAAKAAIQGTLSNATPGTNFRQLYVTGSLQISCGVGVCSSLASSSFKYKGVYGRAIAVYDGVGNNLA
jgi:hypothetical protein